MATQWIPVRLGDDGQCCALAIKEHEDRLHGWAKVRGDLGDILTVYDSVPLAPIERQLAASAGDQDDDDDDQDDDQDTDSGDDTLVGRSRRSRRRSRRKRRRKRIFGKLKQVAKKIGKSKLVKGIVKVARKVLDNPLVQTALASNPFGQAFLAARKGLQIGIKAIKGSRKAKAAIKRLHGAYKKGSGAARGVLNFVRKGLQTYKKLSPRMRLAISRGDEAAAIGAMVGIILSEPPSSTVVGGVIAGGEFAEIMGDGVPVAQRRANAARRGAGRIRSSDDHTDEALDALATFATAGAFAPLRAAVSRLGPHSSIASSRESTLRGALQLGRYAQGQRFAA